MSTTLIGPRGGIHLFKASTPSSSPNPNAWKAAVGSKKIAARFTLLPETKPRWEALGTSLVGQIVCVTLLVLLPMFFPQKLVPMMRYEMISLVAPRTEVPVPPPPPVVRPKVQPPREIPEPIAEAPKIPKIVAPPRLVAPKPKQVNVAAPELKPVFTATNLNVPKLEPARPRPPVETGMLNTGSAAPATINKAIEKVQTGGFGDPEGVGGPGDPKKRANINRKGSFDLPGGPGYGNGTGGASGVRGTVASTGFGNGIAIPPSATPARRGVVQPGGFSDASVMTQAPAKQRAEPGGGPPTNPVEILEKPKPVYTQEARAMKIEGEVLVEVVFTAQGQVRVGRVLKGLGHGLDDAAVEAAQRIRFKPAQRNGEPVDFPATVRIQFQLAY